MKYDLIETIITILDVFYNPIGITSVIIAFLIGILMCIYGNAKNRIVCVCSLLAATVFSIVIFIFGNSLECLILPLFMIPFFVIILIIFLVYVFIRILISIKQKNKKQ